MTPVLMMRMPDREESILTSKRSSTSTPSPKDNESPRIRILGPAEGFCAMGRWPFLSVLRLHDLPTALVRLARRSGLLLHPVCASKRNKRTLLLTYFA